MLLSSRALVAAVELNCIGWNWRFLMWTRFSFGLMIGMCLVELGCSGNTGPARIRVSGIVERQAEPLVDGTITFLPTKGHNGPAANGAIRDGKFDIPSDEGPTAGAHQVLVNLTPGKTSPEFAAGAARGKASSRTRWEFQVEVDPEDPTFDFNLEEE